MNEEIAKAMKTGLISDYFQKPYDVPLIVKSVNIFFSNNEF